MTNKFELKEYIKGNKPRMIFTRNIKGNIEEITLSKDIINGHLLIKTFNEEIKRNNKSLDGINSIVIHSNIIYLLKDFLNDTF